MAGNVKIKAPPGNGERNFAKKDGKKARVEDRFGPKPEPRTNGGYSFSTTRNALRVAGSRQARERYA
jgi:hypothetical protein